jgi:hypothetical protein
MLALVEESVVAAPEFMSVLVEVEFSDPSAFVVPVLTEAPVLVVSELTVAPVVVVSELIAAPVVVVVSVLVDVV